MGGPAMRPVVLFACLVVASAAGCRSRSAGGQEMSRSRPVVTSQPGAVATATPARSCGAPATDATEPPPRPLRRCFPDRPAWLDAPVGALLDRAAELFDDAD